MFKKYITLLLLLLLITIPLHAPFHEHKGIFTEDNCPFCQWEQAFCTITIILFYILFFILKFFQRTSLSLQCEYLYMPSFTLPARGPPFFQLQNT